MLLRYFIIAIVLANSTLVISANEEIFINIPKKVESGNEFIAVISIPANLLMGISRVQITLPNGFLATARNTENAEFKFSEQKAVFQWLSFPEGKNIDVTMAISTTANLEGYYVFKAEAFFLKGSEPNKINIEPAIITLHKANTSDEDMVIFNKSENISFADFKADGITCIRQVPYIKDGEIYVNLLVCKGNMSKYGKIQERIPAGYRVINEKSQNAIFVFNENQHILKYMWMNLPDKEQFVVSYKLVATPDLDESNPFLIYGNFFYAENNSTKSVEIVERGIDLDNAF